MNKLRGMLVFLAMAIFAIGTADVVKAHAEVIAHTVLYEEEIIEASSDKQVYYQIVNSAEKKTGLKPVSWVAAAKQGNKYYIDFSATANTKDIYFALTTDNTSTTTDTIVVVDAVIKSFKVSLNYAAETLGQTGLAEVVSKLEVKGVDKADDNKEGKVEQYGIIWKRGIFGAWKDAAAFDQVTWDMIKAANSTLYLSIKSGPKTVTEDNNTTGGTTGGTTGEQTGGTTGGTTGEQTGGTTGGGTTGEQTGGATREAAAGTSGTKTETFRYAKEVKLKIPKIAKAPVIKPDYIKSTLGMKNGMQVRLLQESGPTEWMTIAPYDKNATSSQLFSMDATAKTNTKASVIGVAEFVDAVNSAELLSVSLEPSLPYTFEVRTAATQKAFASALATITIYVPERAPSVVESASLTYVKANKASKTAAEFKIDFTNLQKAGIEAGNYDKYEYLLAGDSADESVLGTQKWNKIPKDGVADLSSKLGKKYKYIRKTDIMSISYSINYEESTVIYLRKAGTKEDKKANVPGLFASAYAKIPVVIAEAQGETPGENPGGTPRETPGENQGGTSGGTQGENQGGTSGGTQEQNPGGNPQ